MSILSRTNSISKTVIISEVDMRIEIECLDLNLRIQSMIIFYKEHSKIVDEVLKFFNFVSFRFFVMIQIIVVPMLKFNNVQLNISN